MICDQCFREARELGDLVPNHWLIEDKGRYSVIVPYGHKTDILFTFPKSPWPDPDPDLKHDGDEVSDLEDKWLNEVDEWWRELELDPESGYYLVQACKDAGWENQNTHKVLGHWLFNRAGKLIRG